MQLFGKGPSKFVIIIPENKLSSLTSPILFRKRGK